MEYFDIIIWTLFACGAGVMEAGMLAYGGANTKWPYNIHFFFSIPRVIVGLALMITTTVAFGLPWYLILAKGASYVLMFFFWHDGMYHTTRGFLDVKGDNFFSYRDGNAFLDLDFPYRLLALAFGIGFYLITTESWESARYFSLI